MLMSIELTFKIIIIIEYSVFSIIRIQYQRLAKKAGYRTIIEESRKYSAFLSLLICYEVFTLFLYLIYPQGLSWATISISLWLRWFGVGLGVLALLLFLWVHRHLGYNFSIKLRITDQQKFITTGPYQRIRHPMYTAFYMLHIATFLMLANWFIGVTWLVGLTLIIISRVTREEEMLAKRYGQQYINYLKNTGRFIPSINLVKYFSRGRE